MEGACDSNCIFCNYVDGFVDVLMPSVWKWNMFHNNILLVTQRFTVDTGLRWATKMWLSTRTGIQALSTRLLSSRAGGKKNTLRRRLSKSSHTILIAGSESDSFRTCVRSCCCHGHGSEPATNHSVDSGFGYERRRTISVREQRADPRGKEMSVPMPSRSRYVLAVLLFGFFFLKNLFLG